MKIVSWNVNSLSVRLPHVLDYLADTAPDVLALQETKVPDDKFPAAEIEAAGYQVIYAGQKSYNGVALLARQPFAHVVSDLPGLDDPQRRLIAATVDGVRIVNVYIPNGQEVGSDKYIYKLRWLQSLYDFLQGEMAIYPRLVLLGDFNIAPTDLDVHDPVRWRDKITCSAGERAWFDVLLGLGLIDSVRCLYPDQPIYSWWDYRMSAFRRGWGIRIDHILVSREVRSVSAGVSLQPRMLERPSDHAPVWLQFE
ncbi:exodeoxyribonuclease III [Mariprofundus erugo]|uniref:Exodeoxyribonuclease III n=1 Tax=Mariprofundus erugo TaxID=2528639 RepID=A0A5R9GK59_9PROT|nr:exodeoxyribonuclease III [Mariprofundus erugo]TLS66966.1 exodeoxyribonuclease III [Mariprofundus erugo]